MIAVVLRGIWPNRDHDARLPGSLLVRTLEIMTNEPLHPNEARQFIAAEIRSRQPRPDTRVKVRLGRDVPWSVLPDGFAYDWTRIGRSDPAEYDWLCAPNAVQAWWFGSSAGFEVLLALPIR